LIIIAVLFIPDSYEKASFYGGLSKYTDVLKSSKDF